MKVKLNEVHGAVVKDNDTYKLEDNTYLKHLTLSTTFLKAGKQTGGHSHKDQEEVYIFTRGCATMIIGDVEHSAMKGDTFLIPVDTFHQVRNESDINPCAFTCIFESYDRNSDIAKYEK